MPPDAVLLALFTLASAMAEPHARKGALGKTCVLLRRSAAAKLRARFCTVQLRDMAIGVVLRRVGILLVPWHFV